MIRGGRRIRRLVVEDCKSESYKRRERENIPESKDTHTCTQMYTNGLYRFCTYNRECI